MPRKKKYETALIVKDIIARECNHHGDIQGCIMFRFLDLTKKGDRKFLRENIEVMRNLFDDAIKELEEKENKKNGSNDKYTDESEEKTKMSKKK